MRINDDSEITEITIGDKADKERILYTISIWTKNSILIDIIKSPAVRSENLTPKRAIRLAERKRTGKIGTEE